MSTITREPVHWGILGTANIARAAFLPALRATGTGVAWAVGGRDRQRTAAFAREQGIHHAYLGYEAVLDDPRVDAVYIALPNTLHEEWTLRAIERGKAVLCEKPLAPTQEAVRRVLASARTRGALLWEAFVFPFQPQWRRIEEWLSEGRIGAVQEIQSTFHFRVRRADNIRWDRQLAGGSLNDVGCYPVHLAHRIWKTPSTAHLAVARPAPTGVDAECSGVVTFGPREWLVFSAAMTRDYDTETRILGETGSIRLTNPFHPGPGDYVELWRGDRLVRREALAGDSLSFKPALQHIHAVLRGDASPEHLAVHDAEPTAATLAAIRDAIVWQTP
jgi:predicted dehydrogenase